MIADNEIDIAASRGLILAGLLGARPGPAGGPVHLDRQDLHAPRRSGGWSTGRCRSAARSASPADVLLGRFLREVRPFRIYDGPSETHRWAIARRRRRHARRRPVSTPSPGPRPRRPADRGSPRTSRVAGALRAELLHGGRSNLTYRLTDGTARWVLRRPPLGGADPVRARHGAASTGWSRPCAAPTCRWPRPSSLRGRRGDRGAVRRVEYVDGRVLRTRDELAALSDADVAPLRVRPRRRARRAARGRPRRGRAGRLRPPAGLPGAPGPPLERPVGAGSRPATCPISTTLHAGWRACPPESGRRRSCTATSGSTTPSSTPTTPAGPRARRLGDGHPRRPARRPRACTSPTRPGASIRCSAGRPRSTSPRMPAADELAAALRRRPPGRDAVADLAVLRGAGLLQGRRHRRGHPRAARARRDVGRGFELGRAGPSRRWRRPGSRRSTGQADVSPGGFSAHA